MARKNALAVVAWIWREKHLLWWRGYGSDNALAAVAWKVLAADGK